MTAFAANNYVEDFSVAILRPLLLLLLSPSPWLLLVSLLDLNELVSQAWRGGSLARHRSLARSRVRSPNDRYTHTVLGCCRTGSKQEREALLRGLVIITRRSRGCVEIARATSAPANPAKREFKYPSLLVRALFRYWFLSPKG